MVRLCFQQVGLQNFTVYVDELRINPVFMAEQTAL
jgi:hypothetical protein